MITFEKNDILSMFNIESVTVPRISYVSCYTTTNLIVFDSKSNGLNFILISWSIEITLKIAHYI